MFGSLLKCGRACVSGSTQVFTCIGQCVSVLFMCRIMDQLPGHNIGKAVDDYWNCLIGNKLTNCFNSTKQGIVNNYNSVKNWCNKTDSDPEISSNNIITSNNSTDTSTVELIGVGTGDSADPVNHNENDW